jgi:prepilin-type N-terminal cleavage/methylation domain-containing protein
MKKAFTLIELLIVVAIIAILAAIAVPNFLEAQTRAKASRAKADIRTYATAIESYAVDNNRPPLGGAEAAKSDPKNWGIPSGNNQAIKGRMFAQLTTPIAYLTSTPRDPFSLKSSIAQDGALLDTAYFAYQTCPASGKGCGANAKEMGDPYKAAAANGITWYMTSVGPSRRRTPSPSLGVSVPLALAEQPSDSAKLAYPDTFYDPTNGTMSFGRIVRSNKGQH